MLKKPATPQTVPRETRDMRETRDANRLDFLLVSPVPQLSLSNWLTHPGASGK
jgi:hypothetical protein